MVATKLLRNLLAFSILLTIANASQSAVLPEDRIDLLYHSYSGDGITIDGPSILVRKSLGNSVSVSANHYVDSISSASVDVRILGASRYTEERTQNSLSIDLLEDKTLLSVGYTRSEENDYEASSYNIGVSQDFFGDLSNITLAYSFGDDTIFNSTDPNFEEEADRQQYRLGFSQILSPSIISSISYELVTDEGYLQNPYRNIVRFVDSAVGAGFRYEQELYPETRTSDAVAARLQYFLPYRAALKAEYRWYTDSWGIDANTYEIGYTHPYQDDWIFELKFRYYDQSKADFYSDLFSRESETTFRGRDKELSTFSDYTIGLGVSYDFKLSSIPFIEKSSINLQWDYITFNYDDRRDESTNGTFLAGEEPLLEFSANVIKFFVSIWY